MGSSNKIHATTKSCNQTKYIQYGIIDLPHTQARKKQKQTKQNTCNQTKYIQYGIIDMPHTQAKKGNPEYPNVT